MLLAHHPDGARLLRAATPDDPLRVLISACMTGLGCGIDGTDYGMGGALGWLKALPSARIVSFCPEAHTMGVPRGMPDLHGGDGFAALACAARGRHRRAADLTAAMIAGGQAMVAHALAERVELAILTDMSAACGTQVISDGCRLDAQRRYQRGVGVAAALLIRAGIPVLAQRDDHTLGLIRALLDPAYIPDPDAQDHHQRAWYRDYFGL
jgi:uncharacterized protein YbbK (DUF523 family)